MREPWRARVVGRVLVTALALGCDALPGRDEPVKQVAAEPARAAEPAEAARPERGADMPVLRRPVEPGYLAPPGEAGARPVTPTPTEEAQGEPPRWEKLLKESRELSAAGRWENIGPARAKELEAIRAIRELPEDDPRYVEAQCVLAERAHVGADHEAALLGAIARLRARPPANFDKYAHLDRDDLITTTIGAVFTDDGKILARGPSYMAPCTPSRTARARVRRVSGRARGCRPRGRGRPRVPSLILREASGGGCWRGPRRRRRIAGSACAPAWG
jgi:hypothetical protein